jgi:hypothetical protein
MKTTGIAGTLLRNAERICATGRGRTPWRETGGSTAKRAGFILATAGGMIAEADLIDDTRLRADSAEMDHLIGELHERVDPAAWAQIQRVMRCTVELYSQALAHALAHARNAGAEPEQFASLIGEDELLASLLVLHGLHPHSTEQRVRRALELMCEHTGGHAALVALDNRVATITTTLDPALVARALEAAAPELVKISLA